MPVTRRTLLIGAAGLVASAGATLAVTGGFPAAIRAHFRPIFGDEIADHPDTEAFAQDYTAMLWDSGGKRNRLLVAYSHMTPAFAGPVWSHEEAALRNAVDVFIHSSNVVQVHEAGEAFAYGGLFVPVESACANHMSIFWL